MKLLLSLLWFFLTAVAASRSADYAGKIMGGIVKADDLGARSDLAEILVAENQCISSFYHDDAKDNMCGPSTVSSEM